MLTGDQRVALKRWQGYRQLEDAGVFSLVPRASATAVELTGSRSSVNAVAIALGLYGLLVIAVGWLVRCGLCRPLTTYAAIAVLAAVGSSVGVAAGRIGPASTVLVRYASALQQLDAGGSVISMRGVAEYPAFDTYHLRAGLADAAMEPKSQSRSEQWLDEYGYPVLSSVFGLGSSQQFSLEGVVDLSPLDVAKVISDTTRVRVTNVSRSELRECRFPDGFSIQYVGTLRAGQAIEATESKAVDAPFFVCVLSEPPVEFVEERYGVKVEGVSLVSAYLPSSKGDQASPR